MRRIIVPFLAMLMCVAASAEIGQVPPEPDAFGFVILAQSPIVDGGEFEYCFYLLKPSDESKPATKFYMELRDSSGKNVIVKRPFLSEERERLPVRGSETIEGFEARDVQALRDLAPGEYLLAITDEEGWRRSNVERITIHRDADKWAAPVIEASALAPPPYRSVPFFGLRITGPAGLQETILRSTCEDPKLEVDGINRGIMVRMTSGIYVRGEEPETLAPGDRWLAIVDPMFYRSPDIVAPVYTASVAVGPYGSGTFSLAWDTWTETVWDAGTSLTAP